MISISVSGFPTFSPTEGWHPFIPPKGTVAFDAGMEAIFREYDRGNVMVVPEMGSRPRIGILRGETMKRIFILFSLVLGLIIVSTTCVMAGGPPIQTLKGEWATIGTRSCVQADAGGDFGPEPQYRLLTHGSTRSWQSAGVLSLFGNGTGSWSGNNVMINNGEVEANDYPVSVFTTECDVAYQAMPDGTIKFAFDNCISTFTAGYYGPETQGGNTHFTAEYARLSADGITMVFWDLEPRVEAIWITTSGVTTYYNRMCSRTGTAIKLR